MGNTMVLTVISKDMVLSGNVSSKGDFHIDGYLKGDIRSKSITIGQTAAIEGNIYADEIVISGQIKGNVAGKIIKLTASADVTGDIIHGSLSIEAGAHLHGLCQHNENVLVPEDPAVDVFIRQARHENS